VPGRYTIEAYRDVVLKEAPAIATQLAAESLWVLGTAPATAPSATAEFLASYQASYARAWGELLDDLRLKSAASNAEAAQQARALGTAGGPLALLLEAIVRETPRHLAEGSSGPIAPTDPLAPRFLALHGLLARDASGGAPLDAVLQSFRELATLRTSLATATTSAAPSATSHERLAGVLAEAGRAPEPVLGGGRGFAGDAVAADRCQARCGLYSPRGRAVSFRAQRCARCIAR